jgi:hypothetical protein
MKKKLIFYVIFMFSLLFSLNASDAKVYYDDSGKCVGRTVTEFVGTSKQVDIEKSANEQCKGKRGHFCQKLSKNCRFMLESALDGYDIEKGDVYYVIAYSINLYNRVTEFFHIFVEIDKVGKNGDYRYEWVAFCESFL